MSDSPRDITKYEIKVVEKRRLRIIPPENRELTLSYCLGMDHYNRLLEFDCDEEDLKFFYDLAIGFIACTS